MFCNNLPFRAKIIFADFVTFVAISVLLTSNVNAEDASTYLILSEAENLALDLDTLSQSFTAEADALSYQAVADAQYADPRLKVGAMNFPLDTFDRGQEPMTQLQIGVQQIFPRGKTLAYKSGKTESLAGVESARAANQRLLVLRSVRKAYIDLYFQIQSGNILTENEQLFTQLLDITERQYAVGRDNQHDVLRAQLELSLLQDKLSEISGMKEIAIAELSKWISFEHASRTLPDEQPVLNALSSLSSITANLYQHPLILAQDSLINASKHQVQIAKEQYKPGWMLDVTYGERTGRDLNGSGRADFFSAMVLVDIPLFTDKRQDKRLSSSQKKHLAAKFTRTDQLRELKRQTERNYARWKQLGKRYSLYESRTIIEAEQNAKATLKAYQNDIADFTTLVRARLTELNTRLAMLGLSVDQARSQVDLLYYAGEER
jgi:outer membrane protein TolC